MSERPSAHLGLAPDVGHHDRCATSDPAWQDEPGRPGATGKQVADLSAPHARLVWRGIGRVDTTEHFRLPRLATVRYTPSTMNAPPGFSGLRVAAFESRMADDMARLISHHGGQPWVAPAMREVPLESNAEALAFGGRLLAGEINLLLLLTGVGTQVLLDVLQTRYPLDRILAAFARLVLVARGPKPAAALKRLGLVPTLTVPEPNTWRDILHTLDTNRSVRGLRIAVQEYGVSNHELLQGLRERGAEVIRVPVYRWALPENLDPLRTVIQRVLAGEVDVLLITNAAQVEHVMQMVAHGGQEEPFRQALARMVVASIGPTASERLRHHRWPVDLEPSHPKMGLLVKEAGERAGELLASKRSP